MQRIVIDKPYVPIKPYRGKIWPRVLRAYAGHFLDKSYGVTKIKVEGAELLKASVDAGHGVLITPNHSRDQDPFVLAPLSKQVGRLFYLMASWHIFMQSKLQRFMLERAGAFSVYREGMDRGAVTTAIEILEEAERPLVIFAEGAISRTNEHINALLEGTAFIARSAAKKRAKANPPGKVVVHPVAIRYHFHGDLKATLEPVLDEIENRLTWRRQGDRPLFERIAKVGEGLLALKEVEYLGEAQVGTFKDRLAKLIDRLLNPLEDEWLEGDHSGDVTPRVKKLRTAILPDLVKGEIDEAERQRRWRQLADVYLAQQLAHYPPSYVHEGANPERLLETVERFEEDITDVARVHRPMSVTIKVGTAIEVQPGREQRGAPDPIMVEIERQLKMMLGINDGAGTA
jgi:1-acyl-sn-glycerol-3-phosphate acyltransferase